MFITKTQIALLTSCLLLSSISYAQSLLIKQVWVIDEQAQLSKTPKNVLIENGRIRSISSKAISADKIVEANGQYLIPGLIDSHVHLGDVPGLKGKGPKLKDLEQTAREQIPRSYLYFGFTTVLDLASDTIAVKQWNQLALAPHAEFCAPAPIANGYPLAFIDSKQQFNSFAAQTMLYDPQHGKAYPKDFDISKHSPLSVARHAKQQGARCIKTYYEPGFGALRNLPLPSTTLIQDLVKQAKKLNLPVFLHANNEQAYRFGLDTNISVFAHGLWHSDKKDIPKLAEAIAKKGIKVQPTFTVLHGETEMFNQRFFSNPLVKKAIPSELLDWYASDEGQWFKRVLERNIFGSAGKHTHGDILAKYTPALSILDTSTQQLLDKGVELVFGSDTPSSPIFSQFPGLNSYRELQEWIRAGIDLKTLFLALTSNNAKLMGMSSEIGAVKEGLQADLLLLKQNPLRSVDAYNSINLLILDGRIIERDILAAK